MATDYVSQAQAAIFARVIESPLGPIELGEWKEMEGGNTITEPFKVRPPGQPQRAFLNPVRETEDITLRRDFSLSKDWHLRKQLRQVCGVARVQVAVSPLTGTNQWWQEGGNDTYTGVLIDVQPHEINRDNGAEPGQFVLVIATDETVS